MKFLSKKNSVLAFLLAAGGLHIAATNPDEGMYPLSDLNRANLKGAGLKITQKDIYNPGQIGLVDALVRVSGCTGSFVSNNGLLITNHHCAFSAVQLASTALNDYLKNGFVANNREQEIEARGLSIRITDSYTDVSAEILAAVATITDPSERIRVIAAKRASLVKEAEAKDPTIKAEVSEMFIGKSYVLFRYKTIEDVRLVYIPRQDIGEFGGETDNWIWPRHTGDYSFLRAYVGKDGSPAKYSKDNVPYEPKKFLKVNPQGVKENDFVFILGYPGRTFRHRPASYIQYQQQFLLPYQSELNDFQNRTMEEAGKADRNIALALATRIKRNANVMKNYRGKLKGLRNINLLATKQKEDEALNNFIQNNPSLKGQYGTLMTDINALYSLTYTDAYKELWLNNIYTSTSLFQVAKELNNFKAALASRPTEAEKMDFFTKNSPSLKSRLNGIYESFQLSVDQKIASHMFTQALSFDAANTIPSMAKLGFKDSAQATAFVTTTFQKSALANSQQLLAQVLSSAAAVQNFQDPLLTLQASIDQDVKGFAKEQQRREGQLNKLMGDYVAVKEQFQSKNFIPDANSTLRLTYGHVKGYTPVDGSYMKPFTTVKGILEKGNSDNEEFGYPEAIKTAWLAKNFGAYEMKSLGDVPVNMLYNMDTTGGNSGSPIMNNRGELIGVNFDRSYDATINDFAWNDAYSRSIGVDIRYVLWVADKIDNAQFILKEMGVK